MTQEQIQLLFKKGYNQREWKNFLSEIFLDSKFLKNPQILQNFDKNVAEHALKLGSINLNENGITRQIEVYEVKLQKGIVLERNRVGLRNLLRKYWVNIDAAFIVYFNGENNKWRFTYVSELTDYDSEGKFQKIQTEPKRYTYVLGEGESIRTASQRFAQLSQKANKTTLDDVKEAFSVEKLSKEFFTEYKKHYELFCEFMINKPGINATIFRGNEKSIRDFTKKLLGRIVFLYFIQKKGWMGVPIGSKWGQGNNNFLFELFTGFKNKDSFYSEILSKLFFDTLNTQRKDDITDLFEDKKFRIPYLNGGLFEEEDKKQRNIIFNPKLFENLFEFFNHYNFTIYEDDPNDHTIAVDPEMLGHIFENLLEDNKDKGAYYTPKEIVHYMCQESLIEYLSTWFQNKGYEILGYIKLDTPENPVMFSSNDGRKGQMLLETEFTTEDKKIDRSLIEKLLTKKLDPEDKKIVLKYSKEFNDALDKVKICDPAIGSGAFPMGLLQEIFTAKQTLWLFEHGNLLKFPASEIKQNIIKNSIYGVDIEKGAVDIARLRFWLSLVVDEDEPQPLPNLDYKIVVGNSLVSKLGDDIIEIEWGHQIIKEGMFEEDLTDQKKELINKIKDKQKDYFNPNSNKKKLSLEIRNLKIDLLINQLELIVRTKGLEKKPVGRVIQLTEKTERYLKTLGWKESIKNLKLLKNNPDKPLEFFDWKLDFPEVLNELINPNPGFDIIIANPPYIKEYTNRKAFDGFRNSPYYIGKMDIWYGFACKMIDFLKPKGIQCFIAQNNWITSSGASIFRNKVLSETEIKLFTDFGNYKVFESAGIQTMIYLLQKLKPNSDYKLKFSVLNKERVNKIELLEFLNFNSNDSYSEKYLFNLNNSINNENSFTFYNKLAYKVISKIKTKATQYLKESEVAQGIVFPQDFVNRKSYEKLNNDIQLGQGIFVLSNSDLKKISLNHIEKNLIKPYYTTSELKRYNRVLKNHFWIIYTDSKFKNPELMNSYPNLKKHLDRFKNVITSDNKPYGLHRAREENFFKGESIIVQRKCPKRPSFTYTNFDCYVSATFYIIKTNRLNMKFLTGLLNSKLIEFWLRNKGKMQGNNFQIDKEPLLNIPLIKPTEKTLFKIEKLVDKILILMSDKKETTEIENQIDNFVYRLYDLTYDEVKIIDPEFSLSKSEYENIKLE